MRHQRGCVLKSGIFLLLYFFPLTIQILMASLAYYLRASEVTFSQEFSQKHAKETQTEIQKLQVFSWLKKTTHNNNKSNFVRDS